MMRKSETLEDFAWLRLSQAVKGNPDAWEKRWSEDEDGEGNWYEFLDLHINLYVTGLTVALIAFLNMTKRENISVTLYHFDRETGEYFPQNVI